MNVEIGAEAALFPEKEYIKGIFVAVYLMTPGMAKSSIWLFMMMPVEGDMNLQPQIRLMLAVTAHAWSLAFRCRLKGQ